MILNLKGYNYKDFDFNSLGLFLIQTNISGPPAQFSSYHNGVMYLYTSPYINNMADPYTYDRLYGGFITIYDAKQELVLSNNLKNNFSFELSNNQLTVTSNYIYNDYSNIELDFVFWYGRYQFRS